MFVIIREKLNFNIASVDELISLPGIGPITAEKIIAKRVEMGFSSLLKILSVSGWKNAIEKIKLLLNYRWEIESCTHREN